jgi:tRNA pseudouridine55 synthase
MDDKVRIVYKKRGQTPLDCIKEVKKASPELGHLPITYAGRLDPLAEGVLVLLFGDECLAKDEYLKLDKEYEVTVLFGFATDTYDILGKVTEEIKLFNENTSLGNNRFERSSDEGGGNRCQTISNRLLPSSVSLFENILPKFTGRIRQDYPAFSSRTVKGKALYRWARDGKLNEIEIPTHDVLVKDIEIIKNENIKGEDLLNKIESDIALVVGDFRQKEILTLWRDILKNKEKENYKTITLRISCGSGVYVRGIAHDLGRELGISSLAMDIIRTRVGGYTIEK